MGSAGRDWARELGAIEGWWAQLRGMSAASAWEIVDAIHDSWVRGELGALEGDVLETDRRIGAFLREVPEGTRPTYVYREAYGEDDVRRWCWAPEWYLMEQDEDLMLFGAENVAPLLEEAAAGATKGDYAVSIVGHELRDRAHAALFQGPPHLEAVFTEAERVLALIQSPRAAWLATYLKRLLSYRAPHRVDESEARQRVFDLRRCTPNERQEPVITKRERTFRAPLVEGRTPATLIIDIATGAMRAEQSTTP